MRRRRPRKGASLSFGRRGPFRIVQFTDTHLSHPRPQDRRTQALLGSVLDVEQPDLVVLTGDIVSGWETPDAAAAWATAVAPMVERGIRWAAVLGNHDDEGALRRAQLVEVQRGWPGCLTQAGPVDIGGAGNYVLPILDRQGRQPAALLYFLDSGGYSPTGVGHYAWFTHEQVGWYRETSNAWTRRIGRPLPALAFFHIPLPEFDTAWREGSDKRGARNEPVCAPVINSGMFAAFHECGDVVGVFVGHDHVNDFEANLHGIRLCYGRASGYGAYGRPGFARGARVIELTPGRRDFATRVRLAPGRPPKAVVPPAGP